MKSPAMDDHVGEEKTTAMCYDKYHNEGLEIEDKGSLNISSTFSLLKSEHLLK